MQKKSGEKETMRSYYQITSWCRRMMREHVEAGDFCIDATMGNGNDTEYLCRLVGPSGRVLAFDIQPEALQATRERLSRLSEEGKEDQERTAGIQNYELVLDSHAHMADYAKEESASCIVFNLGYLPGGDHRIATNAQSTICALEQGLRILKKNGLMSICIYSGGDSGFAERDAVLQWLRGLDPRTYLVLLTQYYNRPNNPPIPAMVIRL